MGGAGGRRRSRAEVEVEVGKEGEEGITFDVKYTRAQVETYGTATKSWAHLGYRAVGR